MKTESKKGPPRVLVLADFTVEPLAKLLKADVEEPLVETTVGPYGNVVATLSNPESPCWSTHHDLMVLWTRPEAISSAYAKLVAGEVIDPDDVTRDVDGFCSALAAARDRAKFVLVPTWSASTSARSFALHDMRPRTGVAAALMRMNLRLAENIEQMGNVAAIDIQRWLADAGGRTADPRLWYMTKLRFSPEVLRSAVSDIKAAIRASKGKARKLLILDLDDTLWGGIVGDVGWEQLRLGGHDAVGEAFVDFQHALKGLRNRGVVLAVVSKNEESVALNAIRKHPDMVLREADFATWRINWTDKAKNVAEIVEELNLGIDSVVFIDDNPVERDRVREALPQVFVPEWPKDKLQYATELGRLRCFDTVTLTTEDAARTTMYVADRQRRASLTEQVSTADWLASLQMKVTVAPLSPGNAQRAVQLLNKTNQMNLSTRRMTQSELEDWVRSANRRFWTLRVADRFGDSGLTGLISVEVVDGVGHVTDFVLSCRVMGRQVEQLMLHVASTGAKELGASRLLATYKPTEKNAPCLRFFNDSGMARTGEAGHVFVWDRAEVYGAPSHIALVHADD